MLEIHLVGELLLTSSLMPMTVVSYRSRTQERNEVELFVKSVIVLIK